MSRDQRTRDLRKILVPERGFKKIIFFTKTKSFIEITDSYIIMKIFKQTILRKNLMNFRQISLDYIWANPIKCHYK